MENFLEGLMVLVVVSLFCASMASLRGVNQMRRFTSRYVRLLKFTALLCFLAGVFSGGLFYDVNGWALTWNALVFFILALWLASGIVRIRSTLTHGKKYQLMLLHSSIALLLGLVLLVNAFVWGHNPKIGDFGIGW